MDLIDTALFSSWATLFVLLICVGGYEWLREKGFIKSEISKLVIYPIGIAFVIAVFVTVINLFHPVKSKFYVVNGAGNSESVFINNEVYGISPNSYLKVAVRGKSSCRLSSDTGIKERVESGVYIVNLSDHKKVDFEYISYWDKEYVGAISQALNKMGAVHRDTPRGQGVYLVTEDLDDDIYAFDKYAPSSRKKSDKSKVYQLKYIN